MARSWLASWAGLALASGMAAAQAPRPVDSPAPADLKPVAVKTMPVADNDSVTPVSATADSKPAAAVAGGPVALATCDTAAVAAEPAVGGIWDNSSVGGSHHFFFDADYLLWRLKETSIRPIIGTVPTNLAINGDLPEGAISPVFGGDKINYGTLNGLRLETGIIADQVGGWGFDVGYFQLERAATGATFASGKNGIPVYGPVFNDPVANRQDIIYYADPGNRTGILNAETESRFWGFEINARKRICTIFSDRLEFLVGYRHIDFDESLAANGTSTRIASDPSFAQIVSYNDHFGVHNKFDGAQIGLNALYNCKIVYVNLIGKFGIGNMNETANVYGSTQFTSTDPLTPSRVFNGGVLAQPGNSGHLDRNRFCFLGEITANIGIHWTDHFSTYVGYNFLGLSKVARVSDLIDGVDANGVPSLHGTMRSAAVSAPEPTISDGRFWASGLNLGLTFDF